MSDDDFKRAMEAQRRAFEAQFGSLEEMGFEDKTKREDGASAEESADDSDTEGLSGDESDEGSEISDDEEMLIENEEDDDDDFKKDFLRLQQQSQQQKAKVIKFTDKTRAYEQPSKDDLKLLRSGKAPSLLREKLKQQPKKQKNQQPLNAKDEEDAHNDLELQRFLEESHILSNFQSENSGADITLKTIDGVESADSASGPIGKARKFTLDSRLKSLSSINKVAKQRLEKMPMAMRKGMVRSRVEKIAKYEQDAKYGGIILSKVKKGELRNIGGSLSIGDRIGEGGGKKKSTFREKGLKINSVGRSTRNGLVISQKDIERINGTGTEQKRKRKGRGRR